MAENSKQSHVQMDKPQGTTIGDYNLVIQQFLTGINTLSTDYAARIQNFFIEYLGTPQHPVPFGGREKAFAQLNTWLADLSTPPYLLTTAPAGRGKSALLVRWSRELLKRGDIALVFFPVSIRFRTNLAGVVFPTLVARLAALHGEKLTTTADTPLEIWRGLFIEYLNRPLPDGRRLLVILDGVDEAADWEVGPDLFPLSPLPSLHIIVSARQLVGDKDINSWLRRLGWESPHLAQALELHPLTREGVAEILIGMGVPLDQLGARIDIVYELHRLSEGDPLLVRLYVDDLWARGEGNARLQPSDLRSIHPGMKGYFERWWEDQRHLWGKETPLREPAVQAILMLLAGALGPLTQAAILEIASPEAVLTNVFALSEALRPLKRFVLGDGREQGYTFSHPRLGGYFYEEWLTEGERQTIEHRFLEWGRRTLSALNDGHLSPEKVQTYLVQHYSAHLERAKSPAKAFLSLIDHGWQQAWEALEGALAGFLNDVARLWQAVVHEDKQAINAGSPPPYLDREIHCSLCWSSVKSLAKNIPSKLLIELVEEELLNPNQGLAYARQMPDLTERVQALVDLVQFVHGRFPMEVLREVLETIHSISDENVQLEILAFIMPSLPLLLQHEIVEEALFVAQSIQEQADLAMVRASSLQSLLGDPQWHNICKSLVAARSFQTKSDRRRNLAIFSPHAEESTRSQLAEKILKDIQTYSINIPKFSRTYFDQPYNILDRQNWIERSSSYIKDVAEQIHALTNQCYTLEESSKQMIAVQIEIVISTIQDEIEEIRKEMLVMPPQPKGNQHQEMQKARLSSENNLNEADQILIRAFILLIPLLTEGAQRDSAQRALLIVQKVQNVVERAKLLSSLGLPLSNHLQWRQETLKAISLIQLDAERLRVLASLDPYILDKLEEHMLNEANSNALRVQEKADAAWVKTLLLLASSLPNEFQYKVTEEALAVTKDSKDKDQRAQKLIQDAWLVMKSALSTGTDVLNQPPPTIFGNQTGPVEKVLAAMQDLRDKNHRILGNREEQPYLVKKHTRQELQRALSVAKAIRDEADRTQAINLIRQVKKPEVLSLTSFPNVKKQRAQVDQVSGFNLDDLSLIKSKDELLKLVRAIPFEGFRAKVLAILVPSLADDLQSQIASEAYAMTSAIEDQVDRARTLGLVAQFVPVNMRQQAAQEALKAAILVQDMKTRVDILSDMARPLADLPNHIIYPALCEIFHFSSLLTRQEALMLFVKLAPIISSVGGTEILMKICDLILDVGQRWP